MKHFFHSILWCKVQQVHDHIQPTKRRGLVITLSLMRAIVVVVAGFGGNATNGFNRKRLLLPLFIP